MSSTVRQLVVEFGCLISVFVALGFMIWARHRRRLRSRMPIDGLRRRPAGESLRLRLEELDERLQSHLLFFLGVPMLLGLAGGLTRGPWWAIAVMFVIPSWLWSGFWGWRIYQLAQKRANYQLGFDGERFVGEALTGLVAHEFELFHDVPFDGFNIDHVAVGPTGVFAIETKTRRKPVKPTGGKEYRVEFDGTQLHWPTPMGSDAHGIEQAANNARTLSKWLTEALGERVCASPVLTLPGWMVDRKAPPQAVQVVNPKELVKLISSARREALNDNLRKRICYQMEQRCRIEAE